MRSLTAVGSRYTIKLVNTGQCKRMPFLFSFCFWVLCKASYGIRFLEKTSETRLDSIGCSKTGARLSIQLLPISKHSSQNLAAWTLWHSSNKLNAPTKPFIPRLMLFYMPAYCRTYFVICSRAHRGVFYDKSLWNFAGIGIRHRNDSAVGNERMNKEVGFYLCRRNLIALKILPALGSKL